MAAVSFVLGGEYCQTISVFFFSFFFRHKVRAQNSYLRTSPPSPLFGRRSRSLVSPLKKVSVCGSNFGLSRQRMQKCARSKGRRNHIKVSLSWREEQFRLFSGGTEIFPGEFLICGMARCASTSPHKLST